MFKNRFFGFLLEQQNTVHKFKKLAYIKLEHINKLSFFAVNKVGKNFY